MEAEELASSIGSSDDSETLFFPEGFSTLQDNGTQKGRIEEWVTKSESESSDDAPVYNRKWYPHALPEGRNAEGRPVWEPPVLDYSNLIDTETGQSYTKRLEAVMKHTKGDVVRATQIMDYDNEQTLLMDYSLWLCRQQSEADYNARGFFQILYEEVLEDTREMEQEAPHPDLPFYGYTFLKNGDGPWVLDRPASSAQSDWESWVFTASTASEAERSKYDKFQNLSEDERVEDAEGGSAVVNGATLLGQAALGIRRSPGSTILTPGLHLNLSPNLSTAQSRVSLIVSPQLAHDLPALRDSTSDDLD